MNTVNRGALIYESSCRIFGWAERIKLLTIGLLILVIVFVIFRITGQHIAIWISLIIGLFTGNVIAVASNKVQIWEFGIRINRGNMCVFDSQWNELANVVHVSRGGLISSNTIIFTDNKGKFVKIGFDFGWNEFRYNLVKFCNLQHLA